MHTLLLRQGDPAAGSHPQIANECAQPSPFARITLASATCQAGDGDLRTLMKNPAQGGVFNTGTRSAQADCCSPLLVLGAVDDHVARRLPAAAGTVVGPVDALAGIVVVVVATAHGR